MTTGNPFGIFISYRRDDTAGDARHLNEVIREGFPEATVFFDKDTLVGGQQWEREIDNRVAQADVLLALIGPEWETERLKDPSDRLRREIEAALAHGLTVIPVLIGRAEMPDLKAVPESIRDLYGSNKHDITEKHWRADADELVDILREKAGLARKPTQRRFAIPVVTSTIRLGVPVSSMSAGRGAIWVAAPGEKALKCIDPSDESVTTVPFGNALSHVTATEDALWVSSPGDSKSADGGAVTRFDPERGIAEAVGRLTLPNTFKFARAGKVGPAVVGLGAVWVNLSCRLGGIHLFRFDLDDLTKWSDIFAMGLTDVDTHGTVVIGHDAVWYTTYAKPAGASSVAQSHWKLRRHEPVGTAITTWPITGDPVKLAVGADCIWATTSPLWDNPRVNKVDVAARTLKDLGGIDTGRKKITGIAVDQHGVWVVHGKGVTRLDPDTAIATTTVPTPGAVEIATGFGSVWAMSSKGVVYRIDPGG